jgi:anti-sigma B factor antagonist
MDFKVSTTAVDGTGVLVVSVAGELDIATAERLAEPTEVAVEAECGLLLDLSECSFIDSSGLRSVLHAHRELREIGETMVVVTGRNSPVRKMLSLTGIDLSVRIFATRGDAIAWLDTEVAPDAVRASLDTSINGGPSAASPAYPEAGPAG